MADLCKHGRRKAPSKEEIEILFLRRTIGSAAWLDSLDDEQWDALSIILRPLDIMRERRQLLLSLTSTSDYFGINAKNVQARIGFLEFVDDLSDRDKAELKEALKNAHSPP